MNNYGYFPTYTTMLPLYQTVLGNYGIGGTGTQDSSSKSSRNNGMTIRIVSLISSLLLIRRRLTKVLL